MADPIGMACDYARTLTLLGQGANPQPVGFDLKQGQRHFGYKTLCDALKELGMYERQKGTVRFVRDVIDAGELIRGNLHITHHPVIGGGKSGDSKIEDTEFRDPRIPLYYDIEYVEVAYALERQFINSPSMYALWTGIKPLASTAKVASDTLGAIEAMESISDLRKVWQTMSSSYSGQTFNPIKQYWSGQNKRGLWLGKLIAREFNSILDFAEQFSVNETSGKVDPILNRVRMNVF
ncbi:hypothetical protein ABHF33_01215 [Chitinibacter sp. FCG-7]|uniref:Uncharacterized protein n=1 Tax=Chitinibacter mangrovi TaxID=3153927 RepID=A0AAU7FBK6_9NEIS